MTNDRYSSESTFPSVVMSCKKSSGPHLFMPYVQFRLHKRKLNVGKGRQVHKL